MDDEKKDKMKGDQFPEPAGGSGLAGHTSDRRAQTDEVDIITVLKWTGGLTACVLFVMIVSRFILIPFLSGVDQEDRVGVREFFAPEALKHLPVPQLQLGEQEDLKKWREFETSVLTTYGWVDKGNQIARVPIKRAMEMLLEKGVPVRAGGDDSGDKGALHVQ
jgi:hypothetical protein